MNKRGIWSGSFELPSEARQTSDDYRVGKPQAELQARTVRPFVSSPRARSAEPRSTAGCNIKGNRSRKGEWIYHLPGMPYYAQTRPEAMFCSRRFAGAAAGSAGPMSSTR